ncbi:A-kinase anchor protein 8-like isoform X3 [Paramormyrops kingsleyae]|uniref:A-kinase anchor protein 8-like isoform X3 n=1 Tax=Paramormyrops kingsleyae TaxID=1676925 RepID=UPI000CD64F0E|nr:A-kinase anchor protein 8-like isoform X3 [Paramormyrops kingsleyae]
MDSKQPGGAGSWSSAAPSSSSGSGASESYPNASAWQAGYEGYGFYSAQSSSGSDPSADQYVYGSSWEPPRGGTESGVAMSGKEGRGKGQQQGGGGRSSSAGGSQADNPDSIIAKINQRLDLLAKESGGKESQESTFRFECFQSYMLPADKEQSVSSSLYREATAGGSSEATGGAAGMPSPESGSPYSRGRGGAGRRESSGAGEARSRGRGGRDFSAGARAGQHQQNRAQNRRGGGYWRGRDAPPPHQHLHHHSQFSQHSFSCYPSSTPPSSSSSSERLSACWSDQNYMGSCGAGRGLRGRVPSLFPPPYSEFYDVPPPPFPPHHLHGSTMMGGFCQPYGGPQGGSGAWNWNGKTWPRGDRDGRRQRGAGPPTRSAEGKKRRFSQTFDDLEAHHAGTGSEEDDYDQNPFAQSTMPTQIAHDEDDDSEVLEEEAGKEAEKTRTDEEENNEEAKRKRGRKKERQQKDHRLRFTCSMCKFRTVEEKDIQSHLEGRFHKDIFTFLASKIPEAHVKFLQEYTVNRNKKILKKRQDLLNQSETHEKSDPFIGAGQDEFLKRIEAAHCMACDMVIPAQHSLLQQHVNSPEHLCNRKGITEHFKRSSLPIAKSILNSSNISRMLEKYLKGEDPFTDETGDHDPEDDCHLVKANPGEQGASGPRTGALLHPGAPTGPEGAKNDGNEDEGSEEKGVLEEPQEFLEEYLDEEEEDEGDAVE